MSKLAASLPTTDEIKAARVRKGPNGACDVYGPGDVEDWLAVQRLRRDNNWATAHRTVDKTAKVKSPIDPDRFRYHWNGKCGHWTPEQKHEILDWVWDEDE